MNRFLLAAVVLLLSSSCVGYVDPGPPLPRGEVDIGFFYSSLAPHGEWFVVASLGQVWRPYGTPWGWRPYTHGRWTYTVDGWMWLSDWRWGWAPFHYGRWLNHPRHGWIWIPGRTWAPAWVAWREGHGYIGWAPLPPQVGWRVGVGLDLGGVDLDVSIGALAWTCIDYPHFFEPHLYRYVLPPERNPYILGRTRPVVSYREESGRVVHPGIEVERVREVTRRRIVPNDVTITPRPPTRAPSRGVPNRDDEAGTVSVYRPRINGGDEAVEPPQPSQRERPSAREMEAASRRLDEWAREQERDLERRQAAEKPAERDSQADRAATRQRELTERQREEQRVLQERVERERAALESRRERAKPSQADKPSSRKPESKPPARRRKPPVVDGPIG
jgi:hypothetical protein